MRSLPDMVRRQRALAKTVRKYRGKAFSWGSADCVAMTRSHLVAMGHRGLPRLPRYRDAREAKKALKAMGNDSLEGLLDSLLPRIAPAAMLPGDIGLMQGEPPFDALVINVGRKAMGWHQDAEGAVMMTPGEIKAAYRV